MNNKQIDKVIDDLNNNLKEKELSNDIEVNMMAIKKLFENDDTLVTRSIVNNMDPTQIYSIAYCDGMVDSTIINENIIKPLMLSSADNKNGPTIDFLINHVLLINQVKKVRNMKEIIENITYGETALFIKDENIALILNTKGFQIRAITEPVTEKTMAGPREGFSESLMLNLSMIKRKLRTNQLKMKFVNFGKETNTKACICYMDNIVNPDILDELYKRLDKINIDGTLDSNYIAEIIKDSPYTIFKTIGRTERPDTVAGKLLEGRIALVLDGTPSVLTLPYLFVENFQTSEDYYLNYYYTSLTRIIRMIGFFLTTSIPAIYIAVVAFHHEMLPPELLINITLERQSVPLSAAFEAFIMLFIFDILKEAGVRMPANIGQALSIVGALVIGQAAVEAKLVAAPMIIVVAFTGITSLLVPKMNASTIFLRTFLLILASTLGFFGFLIGISLIMIHILNLQSFGIPQIIFHSDIMLQNNKDGAIRSPWFKMKKRQKAFTDNENRMNLEGDN